MKNVSLVSIGGSGIVPFFDYIYKYVVICNDNIDNTDDLLWSFCG